MKQYAVEKYNQYILTTRPIAKSIVDEAAAHNIFLEEMSFIDTKPLLDVEVLEKIKASAAISTAVVFTSMNAVEAVAAQIKTRVNWRVYCMGNTTKKLVAEKLSSAEIAGIGDNAEALAQEVIDDEIKEVIFFCGNIRREELPNKLRSNGVVVNEVVVYQTTEIQNKLDRVYEGILFFSPSAVVSFFKTNKVAQQTKLFAIGNTTKETIRKYADNKIIVAQTADKNELAKQAVKYFR
ncbi:MAG: uroporphyrinogen-III synthase [Bacteroidota bacterium]